MSRKERTIIAYHEKQSRGGSDGVGNFYFWIFCDVIRGKTSSDCQLMSQSLKHNLK